MNTNQDTPSPSRLILYQTEDNRTCIEVRLDEGTVWLTQAQIAERFQTTPQNITLHLWAIYAEGELREEPTCKEYLQVRHRLRHRHAAILPVEHAQRRRQQL
jgi:hypothetical protein